MYLKLLKNDFKKNPWNNAILFLFMSLSVMLAVSVCLMLLQLFSSLTAMYETANPPHFLQMHKGELIQEDIDEFNRDYEGIAHWQTVPLIDVYGEELTVIPAEYGSGSQGKKQVPQPYTLSDCRLDISLVKQNENYDVLLDGSRNKLEIRPGEIGVPVILLEQYEMKPGDTVILKSGNMEKAFVVSDYVYDGQMNSTLCSSTRFLISDRDFEELFGTVGETEYLIEAYFKDTSQAAAYQTAYEQSEKNLPKNGQAVTYTIIFLLSAMTDIMMAMVFLLISILLIAIALICLRYTILAELEEDRKEIGSMKAFGIPAKKIRNLYLGKIRILMATGCVAGFFLSLLTVSLLTNHMSRTFGEQKMSAGSFLTAVPVCLVVYGIVVAFSRRVLGKLRKKTVTDLLVEEKGFCREKAVAKSGIHRAKRLPLNLLLGLREVRHGYGIVFGLLLIVSFLMVVPYRTVQTMEDKEFITYMGSPVCDVLLEAEQGEGLEMRKQKAEELLLAEKEQGKIAGFETLKRVRLQAVGKDGELVGIHIDTGKNAGDGLQLLEGKKPETEKEISLSCLMAEELEKSVGDTVLLLSEGTQREFTVSGIYQDVTSGGRTAKAVRNFAGEEAEQYTFQVMVGKENRQQAEKLNEQMASWREQLGNGYSIENMEEFLDQTLGGVTSQIAKGAAAAFLIGICLTVLIVLLFLKLRMARENSTLAVKRAMGIPFASIRKQELYPVLLAGGAGTVIGILLAEWLGDNLVSLFLGMMGIGLKRIQFAGGFGWQLPAISIVLLLTLTLVTCLVSREIKTIDVAGSCNE